ncbi:pectate lyase [Novosphingobium sp.]|jgi:PelA/Pel-15E family pectate lyase|uniref:pectate lyase n=1 Tax=Novosphingobium sp. TaxID=1874826 RepID=UPI002FE2AD9D
MKPIERRIAILLAGSLLASMGAPAPVQAKVIGTMTPAQPITAERIAALPAPEQAAWRTYLARSQAAMAQDKAVLAAERRGLAAVPEGPAEGRANSMPLDRPSEWYAGREARAIADNIVSFQTPAGGWGKNQDRTAPTRLRGQSFVPIEHLPPMAEGDIQSSDKAWRYVGTIDNDATTTELRFLAKVQHGLPGKDGARYRDAFVRGVDYLLEAQFPNGGWPQVYPLQGGYHDALTFNDNAISQVAVFLQEVGERGGSYAFVAPAQAARAQRAAGRATAVILRSQVSVQGTPTIWAQQYDPLTLEPAGARNFEPTALSTAETVDLLVYLQSHVAPSPAVDAAVHDATRWLTAHALMDLEWNRKGTAPNGPQLVSRPGAGPIWARYYDIATGKPIFGDRDRSIHDDPNEISLERRAGYSWFNTAPLRFTKDAAR